MRWCCAVVALSSIVGCYAPDIATGVPCGPEGQCPGGQICDLGTGLCVEKLGPDAAIDTVTVDAAICDPNEVLSAGSCTIPLDGEVPPAPVSPPSCATGPANVSRSVALDAGNRVYVVFRCGTTNDGFVVTSDDGGATASAPQAVGTALTGLAVQGGPRKVAYVATAGSAGTTFSVTSDGGVTWTTTTLDATVPDAGWGVSVAAAGDAVYVAAKIGANLRVWRNATRGSGTFASTDVAITSVFGEVMADPQTGDVWVGGDSPSLHVRRSQDGGATFAAVIDPAASYNYSDWAIGGGNMFVTGTNLNTFTLLATADPTMVTPVDPMLPAAIARGRAISVRPDAALYVANEGTSGALTFLRFEPGASTAATKSASGTGPSIVPGPGTAAPIVFTDTATTRVHLGVYVF